MCTLHPHGLNKRKELECLRTEFTTICNFILAWLLLAYWCKPYCFYTSACQASDRSCSHKIHLRRAINRSPAHEKSLTSSRIKSTCSISDSCFENWKFPIQSSFIKNVKQQAWLCLPYLFEISYGLCYWLLENFIVHLQSKFKESFYFCWGLKRKLFSLDGVRTALSWPNDEH